MNRRDMIRDITAASLTVALMPSPLRAATRPVSAQMPDMAAFIAALPKAEYHVHLEGTLEPEMKIALAARNGITLPYADVAAMRASYVYHDLPTFLKIYYEGMNVLVTEQDFYDLAYAYLGRAKANNIVYAEMFFDPQEHLKRGVAMATVIGGITRARIAAEQRLGVRSQLILCFVRDLSAQSAMAALDAALPFKQHLIGVGLDSDERGNPPDKFAEHFAKARAAGLHVTAHCDVNQENSLAHIREAIVDLKVERIDHGGNILQSPELIALAKARNLAFTVCPSFSGKIETPNGPIEVVRGMLDAGLAVTINSDDPAYMGSEYLNAVMLREQRASALSRAELIRIERNAFAAAWLPAADKSAYQARLDAFMRSQGLA